MKKKIQKYLSGEREGFSLIELIIVIAIMAILIGIIALAVIPYLEKSRVGKDQQTVDTVYGAFQATIADQKITGDLTVTISPTSASATVSTADTNTTTSAKIISSMEKALGVQANDLKAIEQKLESEDAKTKNIVCTYTKANGEIKVEVSGTDIKSSNRSTSGAATND